jgi:hypothetical protein
VVGVMFFVTVTYNPVTAHDLAGSCENPAPPWLTASHASLFADGSRKRPATRTDRPLPQRPALTARSSGSSHPGRCRPLAGQVAGA